MTSKFVLALGPNIDSMNSSVFYSADIWSNKKLWRLWMTAVLRARDKDTQARGVGVGFPPFHWSRGRVEVRASGKASILHGHTFQWPRPGRMVVCLPGRKFNVPNTPAFVLGVWYRAYQHIPISLDVTVAAPAWALNVILALVYRLADCSRRVQKFDMDLQDVRQSLFLSLGNSAPSIV